jgi:hypothetical protein
MQNKRERWMELAALAAEEQDPQKLIALIQEIDQLLAEKQARLQKLAASPTKNLATSPKPPD